MDTTSQDSLQVSNIITNSKHISTAVVLFKFAQMNSEIKYILHSIRHTAPRYTYPHIADLSQWQSDFWDRLQEQGRSLPAPEGQSEYESLICNLRCNEIIMLLFRPTPRIKSPGSESLRHCHRSAEKTIHLWNRLYELNRLCYSWMSIHALCLAVVTMLYCIWTIPEIAAETELDTLFSTMRISSNLLSAAGEHWPEARRSRQSLEDLVTATVRWLIDSRAKRGSGRNQRRQNKLEKRNQHRTHRESNASQTSVALSGTSPVIESQAIQGMPLPEFTPESFDIPGIDTYIDAESLATFVGAPSDFANDLSTTMDSIFSDFQPTFDFDMLDTLNDRGGFQFW